MRVRRACFIALLGAALFAPAGAFAADRGLSSEVTLQPASQPGTYRALVEIRDASSGQVLSAPMIAFARGELATTKTTLSTGEEVHFSVRVDASGASASFTAEIRSGGRSVALQKATIALSR